MVRREIILLLITMISGFVAYLEIKPTATLIAKLILVVSFVAFLSHIPSDSSSL